MNFTKKSNSEKIIFLIDFDAFFASCHIIENPSYKNKPLAVAYSEKYSIITAASYSARKFGVKAGLSAFKAIEICPELLLVKPNYSLYSKASKAVFKFFYENYSKRIELASIDECYMDVTNEYKKYGSVSKMAQHILNSVQENFNITCSIGISTNKILAKVACDRNKPNGYFRILPFEIENKLWPLHVGKMFGVGTKTALLLEKNNINTIGDLAKVDKNFLIDILNKPGLILWNRANGMDTDVLDINFSGLKSLGSEVTFNQPTQNLGEIEQFIYDMSFAVRERLLQRNLGAKTITVVLRYQEAKLTKKRVSMQQTLDKPIHTLEDIFAVSKNNFYKLWDGSLVRLVGVRASNTAKEYNVKHQLDLNKLDLKFSSVEKIVDGINEKLHQDKLLTGANLKIKLEEEEKVSKFQKGEFNDNKRRS
ncbi:DNA polymerase IV [Spiroplasma sp. TIUS-1]|uniref:DNA polymerase IV n=1 Tax=Spiroplasma sp. TIUS-1 TaxID=216963 RepID=UPI0013A6E337|nr:DNA polymerase IV [Spiroplasma sp. TIUS-1]